MLTEHGFSTCVYEEIAEANVSKGPVKKSKLKNRILTQIISPGMSTYTYDLCLKTDDIDFRIGKPIIGIFSSNNGFTIIEIHLDERSVIVSERLTEESVRSMISTTGCIEPLYINKDVNVEKDLCFLLPYSIETLSFTSFDSNQLSSQLLRHISKSLITFDYETFRFSKKDYGSRPRPIYTSTALQIGLLQNENVPSLISNLLTKSSYAYSSRFLQKWITNPPPLTYSYRMQNLCRSLSNLEVGIVKCQPVLEGKIVSLLLAKQCNIALFRDIKLNVNSIRQILELAYDFNDDQDVKLSSHPYSDFVPDLLEISMFESSISISVKDLYVSCLEIIEEIDNVILPHNGYSDSFNNEISVDSHNKIPDDFFINSEELIKNKVISTSSAEIEKLYKSIDKTANMLCEAVHMDFPDNKELVYDSFSNQLMLNSKPTNEDVLKHKISRNLDASYNIEYIKVSTEKFRKNSRSVSRYTTENVDNALNSYLKVIESGPYIISSALQDLSGRLSSSKLLISIIECGHIAVILQSINNHVISSKQKGWNLPKLIDFPKLEDVTDETRPKLKLLDLTPYWIDRRIAKKNNIVLDNVMLLTAPNMSGKSTLMRSVLVIALLANCGLYVPSNDNSEVPRFDCFFLRTASYDIPSEAKSAFALEMDDVRILLRDSTHQSLVMMDEIGKGTSARL